MGFNTYIHIISYHISEYIILYYGLYAYIYIMYMFVLHIKFIYYIILYYIILGILKMHHKCIKAVLDSNAASLHLQLDRQPPKSHHLPVT
jgi:hypothetical protein